MNSIGGISIDTMPPIETMNYECRYCGAKCAHTTQEAYRADDPPAKDYERWTEPTMKSPMTTPQPQATGNPQAEDMQAIEFAFDAGETEALALGELNFLAFGDANALESITEGRAAFQRYRDHAAAVEAERDRLHAFVEYLLDNTHGDKEWYVEAARAALETQKAPHPPK